MKIYIVVFYIISINYKYVYNKIYCQYVNVNHFYIKFDPKITFWYVNRRSHLDDGVGSDLNSAENQNKLRYEVVA